MCDPISIATVGIGIVSAGTGYMAQQEQYKTQKEVARQNAINASKATYAQYDNLNLRAVQEDVAMNQQKQQTMREEAQGSATAEVAASAAGISGLSVDHLMRDIAGQAGRASAALDTNQQFSRLYLQGEMKAAQSGGQNQINSMPVPEKPSILPALINVFSTGVDAYAGAKKRQ